MEIEIIVALAFWLAVTIFTPARIRPFISIVTFLLIGILVFYHVNQSKNEIHVPAIGDNASYKLSIEDYQKLATKEKPANIIQLPNMDSLKKLNKKILTHRDLSPEQLKALESYSSYQEFTEGRLGLIIEKVSPGIQEQKFEPGFDGVIFTDLPFYDVTKSLQQKQNIIDAIKQVVLQDDAPRNI